MVGLNDERGIDEARKFMGVESGKAELVKFFTGIGRAPSRPDLFAIHCCLVSGDIRLQ